MNANSPVHRSRGQIDQRVLIALAAILVVVLAVVYLLWPQPEPVPVPDPGLPGETVAPAETAEERGDSAREIINRLEADPEGPDYAEAHASAERYRADGRLADAQLLYFFAARGGHATAAFDLATFSDPNHHAAEASLMAEPDPFQAYRWYTAARDSGHEGASARLEELRAWAEAAGRAGDSEAERLLLQWEQAP